MARTLLLVTGLIVVGAVVLVAASGSAAAHDHMECTNSYEPDTPHPSETCVPASGSTAGDQIVTDSSGADGVMEPRRVSQEDAHEMCEMWADNAGKLHGTKGELFSPSFIHAGQYQQCTSELEGMMYDELENPP